VIGPGIPTIVVYSTYWCPDRTAVKNFLKERRVPFEENNIEKDPVSEDLVARVNHGK
jgi:glutaredoxin